MSIRRTGAVVEKTATGRVMRFPVQLFSCNKPVLLRVLPVEKSRDMTTNEELNCPIYPPTGLVCARSIVSKFFTRGCAVFGAAW